MDIKPILPCIILIAHTIEIINFPVSVKDASGILSGSIIDNIRDELDKISNVILGDENQYKENIIKSLCSIFHSIIRPLLNTLSQSY